MSQKSTVRKVTQANKLKAHYKNELTSFDQDITHVRTV